MSEKIQINKVGVVKVKVVGSPKVAKVSRGPWWNPVELKLTGKYEVKLSIEDDIEFICLEEGKKDYFKLPRHSEKSVQDSLLTVIVSKEDKERLEKGPTSIGIYLDWENSEKGTMSLRDPIEGIRKQEIGDGQSLTSSDKFYDEKNNFLEYLAVKSWGVLDDIPCRTIPIEILVGDNFYKKDENDKGDKFKLHVRKILDIETKADSIHDWTPKECWLMLQLQLQCRRNQDVVNQYFVELFQQNSDDLYKVSKWVQKMKEVMVSGGNDAVSEKLYNFLDMIDPNSKRWAAYFCIFLCGAFPFWMNAWYFGMTLVNISIQRCTHENPFAKSLRETAAERNLEELFPRNGSDWQGDYKRLFLIEEMASGKIQASNWYKLAYFFTGKNSEIRDFIENRVKGSEWHKYRNGDKSIFHHLLYTKGEKLREWTKTDASFVNVDKQKEENCEDEMTRRIIVERNNAIG